MKLKDLEYTLSSLKPFKKPKVELEQYATDAHIAARMIYTAATTYDDITEKSVLDLGCGCGVLSLAALMMGADTVLGIDIDSDALEQSKENMEELEFTESDGFDLIQTSIYQIPRILRHRHFDTIITNPPFGTKDNSGIDVEFLKIALSLGNVVYSMHKSSTREFIVKKVTSWGASIQVLAQMKFLILKQFKFHQKEKVYVDVDLIRIEKTAKN